MSENPVTEKVGRLPNQPGVYQFLDEDGNHLYIGKAIRLRNRVKSYFQQSRQHNGRLKLMISKIRDLDVIVTDSEAEALILENTLIKKHHPRYNVMYRDDKSYPYICLTADERPRVYPTRTLQRDGSKYFGPYDHVGHMRRMLEAVRQAFGLCTCAVSIKSVDKSKGAPRWHSCFDDYLGNCSADMDPEKYNVTIRKIERILNGKTEELIRELKEEMQIASDALAFEEAGEIRDSIESLVRYNQKMKMVAGASVNRDLFAVVTDGELDEACGVLLKVREGKVIGKFHRFLKNIEGLSIGELLQSFVEDYYTEHRAGGSAVIPDEVYVSEELPEGEPLAHYLWEEKGVKVPVLNPKIGEKKQLIVLAETNARLQLGERKIEKEKANKERIPQSVKDLKEFLHLQRLPRRIECFDNSNIQGADPVASMVCFVDGQPRKGDYKKFHIKSVTGPDDYASMKEVLSRRYSNIEHIPDLIVIDGGKGQLGAAIEALKEIGFYGECEIVGLAKRLEEVFLPGKADPVMIPKRSPALKLLQRARDEAHRFAITFHKKTRSKRTIRTELTSIRGVGEKTATKLIRAFGSVKKVSEASAGELAGVIGEKTGQDVYGHFHPDTGKNGSG